MTRVENDNPLDILGISSDAGWRDVKRAYRSELKRWHPDRFARASQSERDAAEERSRAITKAFREIKEGRSRGRSRSRPGYSRTAVNRETVSPVSQVSPPPVSPLGQFTILAGVVFLATTTCLSIHAVTPHPLHAGLGPQRPAATAAIRVIAPGNRGRPSSELTNAAVTCDLERTAVLLDRGASIDARDALGETALAWAVKSNCEKVAWLLLTRGADRTIAGDNGFTPLRWAQWNRNEGMRVILSSVHPWRQRPESLL